MINENRMVPGGGFEPPTRGFSSRALPQGLQSHRLREWKMAAFESIMEIADLENA